MQRLHDVEGQPVVAAKQAVRALFQQRLQRVRQLGGVLHPVLHQAAVLRDAELRQGAQIPVDAVLVHHIGGRSRDQRDPSGAQAQQQPGHLIGSTRLVVVHLGDLVALAPPDHHIGHRVLAQKIQAGVVLHGAGEDDPVRFVVGQLPFQLGRVRRAGIAQKQVIPPLRRHHADAPHALAQKGQVQLDKMIGDDHAQIVGGRVAGPLGAHDRRRASAGHIVAHPLAGAFADASLARQSAGYRCF